MKSPILTVELVPKTAWYKNLRSELPEGKWDQLRKHSYRLAEYKCEICSCKGDKWPVECHEIWEYDDVNHIQKLTGVISLRPSCHKVKHIGREHALGRAIPSIKHLATVNNWSRKDAEEYIKKVFKIWKNRSQHKWHLNLSWALSEEAHELCEIR